VTRRLALAALCALVLAGCSGGDGETTPAWNHDPEDAALGPAGWGEIDESFEQCAVGTEQSPVDIAGAVEADLPDLEFDYPETSLVVENTGHTIEATLPEDSDTLRIGDDEYRLVQFHFHAPSEHTVDGKQYDGEVHLVHESEEGDLAVVAVFLEPGDVHIPLVDSVLESAPDDAGEEVELEGEWSPLLLLLVADSSTAYGAGYHTYPGSLTTPGCTGGVRWIVETQGTYPTSPAAIERLHELIGGFPGYDGYENNNRPTQRLNERVIQRDSG
jgi:carbonic anhydrase